jgi:RNA polymerase sigma factor (sigma-70 family)
VGLPAFQQFLDSSRHDVHRFLVAAVGPVDADDCFQETFIAALRAYPSLRDGSNLRGWVLTIAHNKAMDFFRARSRRPTPAGDLPDVAVGGEPEVPDGRVWALVRALPEKQRAVVLHRYVNDLSYKEIGAVVGCSEAAARQSAREALIKLKEVWTP